MLNIKCIDKNKELIAVLQLKALLLINSCLLLDNIEYKVNNYILSNQDIDSYYMVVEKMN